MNFNLVPVRATGEERWSALDSSAILFSLFRRARKLSQHKQSVKNQ